jgi:hypothetical protein
MARTRTFPHLVRMACALALLATATAWPSAQSPVKKPLTVDDYTKWRSIVGPEISGDGRWVVYTLQLMNTAAAEARPVLHLKNLASGEEITVEHATGGTFSPDSKWVAYQVDPGAAQRARAGRGGGQGGSGPGATPGQTPPAPPPPAADSTAGAGRAARGDGRTRRHLDDPAAARRAAEPRDRRDPVLAGHRILHVRTDVHAPRSAPAPGGYRRRRGRARRGRAGRRRSGRRGGAQAPQPGLDAILLDLRTGRHQLLGSVNDAAFNRTGDLLAYTVDATVKDGNGLFVFDARTDRITPLDNDAKHYSRLTWNEDGNAIAVLKGLPVEKMRERNNVLLAIANVPAHIGRRPSTTDEPDQRAGPSASGRPQQAAAPAPVVLDPEKTDTFPKGWVISERATLAWSEDNRRVFLGIKEQAAAPPENNRRGTDEVADVDVWNTTDERIQSAQMVRAEADRNFTFRQAFDVADARFVKLADETMRDLDVAPDGKWAIGRDARGYVHDFNRPAADLYRVNTSTGERTLIAKGAAHRRHVFGISPHGRHFLYWKDHKFQAYDLESGRGEDARRGAPELHRHGVRSSRPAARVRDRRPHERRHRRRRQPPVRFVAAAARRVGAQEPDGGAGREGEMRLRYARVEPSTRPCTAREGPRGTIDLSKPLTLSAYGEYTKKAGFYELAERPVEGAGLRGRLLQHAGQGGEGRHLPLPPRDVREVSRTCSCRAPASATRRRSATRIRSTPSTRGAGACCSTTRTRTACACRASSRCPTTTSRARSAR